MAFKVRSDTASLLEDAVSSGNVLTNDSSATLVTQVKTSTGTYVPVSTAGVTLQGTYGFLTIYSNGTYNYTANTAAAEGLKSGATASDTFTYTATGGTSSGSTTLKFTVTGVNDAPVLTSTTAALTTITEDQTTNSGQAVSTFLQSTDVDSSAVKGVAITSLSSGNGVWQYSTNGGTSWIAVGTVSDASALLLRSTDKIRFVPNAIDGTTASFTYHAWDQTSGTYGTKVDTTVSGGQTAFSTDIGTASIVVTAINDAPVGVSSTASGNENDPVITGQVHATDVDSPTLTYSLVANSTVGGSVTIDPTTGNYSFTPSLNFSGTASFQFMASDGSLTSAATPVTITVAPINNAPVLTSTTATLTTITEDQTTNAGQRVSTFLQSTDADTNALAGIALTGLDSGNGRWQYSTNGTTWTDVGTVSDSSALLLRSTDYIRFVPNAVDGTAADFFYHAWDQTSGTVGTKVDATVTGGQTAFSTDVGTASITVTSVNDAPVATAGTASGVEDGAPITGQVQATDVDSTTLTYSAVANSAVGGTVTIDPTTGNYTFTPATNFSGTASFGFTANDGSLTSAPATVSISIAPVNDTPVANNDSGSTTQGVPVLINVLANDTDVDGDTLTISAVGAASNGTVDIYNGQVRYSPNSGYTGSDAFTYSISDGHGGTATGNVSVDVGTAPPPAAATSVSFRQGTAGYTGAVDTMLREHYPTDNYSNAFVISPQGDSTKHTQGLLQFGNLFGTGPGQIPVGATIVSATLTLMTTQPTTDGGTINPMLVSWGNTSTWNSMGSGVQIGTEASSSNVVTVGAATVGLHSYDISASVQAWASAGTTAAAENAANHGWVFNLPSGTDFWNFTSSEGDLKPVLSVTYVPAGSSAPASLPTVSISAPPSNVPQMENSGKITFTVTLSQAATQDVTVGYSTADGTAKAGSDYTATTGTVTFHAGETSKTFDVLLTNDSTAERIENFTAQITSVTGASIATATADAHITDDDVVVAPYAPLNATIVHSYDLSNGSVYLDGSGGTYGIGDPSGIAYIPSLGQLFIADSEHDESPYFSKTNMFSLNLDGSYVRNYSLESYTSEDTGLAYDPNNGFLYVSDDSKAGVFWVDPLNPTVKLGFFDTKLLGYQDTEDLKIDPLTGHIHEVDGELMQLIELTTTGQFVDSVPLPSVMKDAEALAYDPKHDVYFVSSGHETNHNIYVIDPLGHLLDTISVLSPYSGVKVKGLELAPSSDPNDGNQLSLYVADYGADQVNDGRLWEIHLGPDWTF